MSSTSMSMTTANFVCCWRAAPLLIMLLILIQLQLYCVVRVRSKTDVVLNHNHRGETFCEMIESVCGAPAGTQVLYTSFTLHHCPKSSYPLISKQNMRVVDHCKNEPPRGSLFATPLRWSTRDETVMFVADSPLEKKTFEATETKKEKLTVYKLEFFKEGTLKVTGVEAGKKVPAFKEVRIAGIPVIYRYYAGQKVYLLTHKKTDFFVMASTTTKDLAKVKDADLIATVTARFPADTKADWLFEIVTYVAKFELDGQKGFTYVFDGMGGNYCKAVKALPARK